MIFKIKIKNVVIFCYLLLFCTLSSANEIFVSLKKSKVNVRYGPSFDSDVKYVYKKIDLPIKQIDKKENFRRIIDFKNNSGWIHVSQLKESNSVITTKDKVLFKNPSSFTRTLALLKKGRLLILEKCKNEWCFVNSGGYKGWIDKSHLWGNVN